MHFFGPAHVFSRFSGPGRIPKLAQDRPQSQLPRFFLESGDRLFALSSLGYIPEGSRTISGGSGDPFRTDSGKIFSVFGTLFGSFVLHSLWSAVWRRNSLGCAGMVPEYTDDLRNSLSGVLLEYGDLAKSTSRRHRPLGFLNTYISLSLSLSIYIYIYVCACVRANDVCVFCCTTLSPRTFSRFLRLSAHTRMDFLSIASVVYTR